MRYLIPIILLLACTAAHANPTKGPERGVWFWQGAVGDPLGSKTIVGDPALEDAMITFLKGHKINKVYGSYGTRTTTSTGADEIAAWNVKLHAAGIGSQMLLSETSWIFPDKLPNLTAALNTRLVAFNNARLPDERFDGLHFDVEPQSYKDSHDGLDNDNGWSDLTDSQKRDYVVLLGEMYANARTIIDAGLFPGFPIWGDIPVWYDSLTSSVGWDDAAQRDAWFANAESNLTGFVIMPFELTSFSSIDSQTQWERDNITTAEIRYSLRATVGSGTGDDWPTIGHFFAMRDQVEDAYGFDHGIDIQDYADYRTHTYTLPGIVSPALFAPPVGTSSGLIELHAAPQLVYFLHISSDLCQWKTAATIEPQREGPIRLPLDATGTPRSFYRLVSYPIPRTPADP